MIELRSEDGGWESEHGRATVDCCLSSIELYLKKGQWTNQTRQISSNFPKVLVARDSR